MATWKQYSSKGEVVAVVTGRTVGMFGITRRHRGWQIDHIPSGFCIVSIPGWDMSKHIKVAKELKRIIDARYHSGTHNPWEFSRIIPKKGDKRQMKEDMDTVRMIVVNRHILSAPEEPK